MQADYPGKLVAGKYELIELVGQGGMSIVWRAVTRGAAGFRRPIAIKRLVPACAAYEDVRAMFIEEARIGTVLRHPNIVQVHDFGIDEQGDYYLVTEWVDGLDLKDYLARLAARGRSAPWPLIGAVAVEVLRALDAAHSRSGSDGAVAPILHRDVSPTNILMDVEGMVKLIDFGMALSMDRDRITRPDIVKGKLSYLAPEIMLGAAPTVQSDLFGLGVVLWEAFAGERLFDAATDVEVVELVRTGHVPLLSARRPELPVSLVSLVHRALARQPNRRFRSAREMLRELTLVLRALPDSVDGTVLAEAVAAARVLPKSETPYSATDCSPSE
jgi:serine/threonine protein kinase